MAATVPNAIVVEVLNEKNYKEWSIQVETFLLAEGLWDIVESTAEPPTPEYIGDVKFLAWRTKNAKALHAIQISCGIGSFSAINDIREANVAWNTLKKWVMSSRADACTANDDWQTEVDWEEQTEEICTYNSFFDNVKHGNWDAAKAILTQHGEKVRAGNPFYVRDVLLPEIKMGHVPLHIIRELVELTTEEDLEIIDEIGATPFCYAVHSGLTQTVICMAKKNKKLPSMRLPPLLALLPVTVACGFGLWEMGRYLYSETPRELLMPENGFDGAELLAFCFSEKQYDTAWDLISHFPNLAVAKACRGGTLLQALASWNSAFLSRTRLTFWQKWIYDCMYIEPSPTINIDICVVNGSGLEDDNGRQRNRVCSSAVMGLLRRLVMNRRELWGINHIYDMKLMRIRTLEFLRCMCEVPKNGNYNEMQRKSIENAIFLAVRVGNVEFITHMWEADPSLQWVYDEEGRNIFQYAVECRQEKVYKLMHGLQETDQKRFLNAVDKFNNSILHGAGILSAQLISQIQGAALQMQRELQWFKEVENNLSPGMLLVENFTNHKTARELFTENHKELVKEGEKSIKETATSCTVVGALIVTIMFAAAFTLPGGNKEDTGIPIFLDKKLFMVFIVSDAISLFSALTSVIIFLGLLTSRYAENDFLISLPTKLILGLVTLFLSITAMMIAFSSSLFIMLHEKSSNIGILVISLASVPIISFVGMHFPLFVETCVSTYGKGIFDKKVKPNIAFPA